MPQLERAMMNISTTDQAHQAKQAPPLLRFGRWLFSAAAMTAVLLASLSASAQNFTPPVQLTTNPMLFPGGAYLPSVNIDSVGNVGAVWSNAIPSATVPVVASSVELTEATLSATGALQTHILLPAAPPEAAALYPQLKTDAAGNSTLVWLQNVASTTTPGTIGGYSLMSADKPAGGIWATPVAILGYVNAPGIPYFSMNSKGDAIITIGADYTKRVAGSSAWSAFAPVATLANAIDPLITSVSVGAPIMGENGDAIVQWFGAKVICPRRCVNAITEYRIARLPNATTTWQHSGLFVGGFYGVTMDKLGRVMAVVPGTTALGVQEIRSATQLGAGKPWSAPVAVFTPVDNYFGIPPVYGVASDDAGNVTVVFGNLQYTNVVKSIVGNIATNTWGVSEFINGFAVTTPSLLRVGANGAALLTSGNFATIRPSATSPWGGVVNLDATSPVEPRAAAINAYGQAVIIASKLNAAATGNQLYAVTGSNTGPTLLPSQVLPAAPSGFTSSPAIVSHPSFGTQLVLLADAVLLNWTNRAYNATTFFIDRCKAASVLAPCTDFQQIATLAATVSAYKDTNVVYSSTYFYRLRASNLSGFSASVTAYGQTTFPIPAYPTNIVATATSPTTARVTWTDNATDELSYFVQRCVIDPASLARINCVNFEAAANITTFNDTGLLVGTSYGYSVTAHGALGDSYTNFSPPITMPVETPLAAPTGVTVTVTSSTTVTVNWIDYATNEASYVVLRCLTNGTPCTGFYLAANVTTYNDTGLKPGTTYIYYVESISNASMAFPSAPVTVTMPTGTGGGGGGAAPASPTALVSGAVTRSQAVLNWTDNATNELNYLVERCRGSGCTNFSQVASVSANATTYSVSGLRANSSYSFRVRATNAAGQSAYSNVLSVTTLP